jgi:SAM-dependent methyltransferase
MAERIPIPLRSSFSSQARAAFSGSAHCEIEAIIRHPNALLSIPEILRLRRHYQGYEQRTDVVSDVFRGRTRERTVGGVRQLVMKSTTLKLDVPGAPVTLKIANETPVSRPDDERPRYRRKERTHVDLGHGVTLEINFVDGRYYEVEVEAISASDTVLDHFYRAVEEVVGVVMTGGAMVGGAMTGGAARDTEARDQANDEAIAAFCKWVHYAPSPGNKIPHHFIMQPRSLKKKDLVLGGVVPRGAGVKYYVAPKADGVRYFLFFSQGRAMLISPPSTIIDLETRGNIAVFEDYLLEGELVEGVSRGSAASGETRGNEESARIFKAYDCLTYPDPKRGMSSNVASPMKKYSPLTSNTPEVNIALVGYTDRRRQLGNVVKALQRYSVLIDFDVEVKEAAPVEDVESFYVENRAILERYGVIGERSEWSGATRVTNEVSDEERVARSRSSSPSRHQRGGSRSLSPRGARSSSPSARGRSDQRERSGSPPPARLADTTSPRGPSGRSDKPLPGIDGLIFTPDTAYSSASTRFKLGERVLTKHPDICKFKLPSMITVDLQIGKSGFASIVLAWDRTTKALVEFRGTPEYPLIEVMESPLLAEGVVIEFRIEDSRLYATRPRDDKDRPNDYEVVVNNWADAHDPITVDTMIGESFQLVRYLHNRVKGELFARTLTGEHLTLLDIGSGRGGDLRKMSGYERVYAVEPNADHREEFSRRLRGEPREGVRLIPAYGQDTEVIREAMRGERADVISLMLSLSFFYQSDELLARLVDTLRSCLKPGGTIIALTIDGDKVTNVLGSSRVVRWGRFTLERLGGNEVMFDLPDSIASKQTEWLVDIKRLHELTGGQLECRDMPEGLLSEHEARYNGLYTSFRIVNPTFPASHHPAPSGRPVSPHLISSSRPDPAPSSDRASPTPSSRLDPTTATHPTGRAPSPERAPSTSTTKPPITETTTDKAISSQPPPPIKEEPMSADTRYTPPLPITSPGKPSHVSTLPGVMANYQHSFLRDDTMIPIATVQSHPIYSVGCLADGSCFFHAYLKAISPEYRACGVSDRVRLATGIREELARLLSVRYPSSTNADESVYDHLFAHLGDEFPSHVDLVRRVRNPHVYVGTEVIPLLRVVVPRYNVMVVMLREHDLRVVEYNPAPGSLTMIIIHIRAHYELLAFGPQQQTLFAHDDPLLTLLQLR